MSNRWTSDACTGDLADACSFEIEHDADGKQVYKAMNKRCSKHANLSGAALHAAAIGDNVRKNKVHGKLIEFPALQDTLNNEDGSTAIVLKKGVTLNMSWAGLDDSRVLTVSVTGANLTNQQKNTAQTWCDANLGTGKVVIQ